MLYFFPLFSVPFPLDLASFFYDFSSYSLDNCVFISTLLLLLFSRATPIDFARELSPTHFFKVEMDFQAGKTCFRNLWNCKEQAISCSDSSSSSNNDDSRHDNFNFDGLDCIGKRIKLKIINFYDN